MKLHSFYENVDPKVKLRRYLLLVQTALLHKPFDLDVKFVPDSLKLPRDKGACYNLSYTDKHGLIKGDIKIGFSLLDDDEPMFYAGNIYIGDMLSPKRGQEFNLASLMDKLFGTPKLAFLSFEEQLRTEFDGAAMLYHRSDTEGVAAKWVVYPPIALADVYVSNSMLDSVNVTILDDGQLKLDALIDRKDKPAASVKATDLKQGVEDLASALKVK